MELRCLWASMMAALSWCFLSVEAGEYVYKHGVVAVGLFWYALVSMCLHVLACLDMGVAQKQRAGLRGVSSLVALTKVLFWYLF